MSLSQMDEKDKCLPAADLKDPGNGKSNEQKPESPKRANDAATKRREVTLAKPHRHRGVLYQPGDTIELRPDQAERLKKQGVIR